MKKLISLLCLLGILCMNNAVYASILVKEGTDITIIPNISVTSKNPANQYQATIKDDVIVNGVKIFQAGDKAVFNIADYEKAGCWGIGGNITIANGYAYDIKGDKHKILVTRKFDGKDKNWVKGTCAAGLLLWPLLLFGFVHGNEAKILPNTEIDATLANQFDF